MKKLNKDLSEYPQCDHCGQPVLPEFFGYEEQEPEGIAIYESFQDTEPNILFFCSSICREYVFEMRYDTLTWCCQCDRHILWRDPSRDPQDPDSKNFSGHRYHGDYICRRCADLSSV